MQSTTLRVSAAALACLAGMAPALAQSDSCANATTITVGTYSGTTAGAAPTAGLTSMCGISNSSPDVWYRYVPAESGQLTVSTCGSSWDTVLSLHSACPTAGNDNSIVCNDDSCNLQSQVQWSVQAGVPYLIRVSGYNGGSGPFTLGVSLGQIPPGSVGPDVVLSNIQDTTNYGQVGGVRAYSYASYTCNVGDQNLTWASGGTPGLAMNLYRIEDQRMVQVGLGFCKTACCAGAGQGPCGTCNGVGGGQLGAGCLDVYGSSYNGGQTRLAPRSAINGYTGAFSSYSQVSGDAIFRRLQVQQADLNLATHPAAVLIMEGAYVGTDDAQAHNGLNNATWQRATLDASYNLVAAGAATTRQPAIFAWHDHGLGAGQPDSSVTVDSVDIAGEGRFYYAFKARNLGNGSWRYEYAVFNMNSDRSGQSFSVPVPAGVTISNSGFSAPFYHSGEVYSNAPWTFTNTGGTATWSTQTFAANANANAIRWGTMYNFWFDANTAPQTATATLGLFKPGTPTALTFAVSGPSSGACYANCDGSTAQPLLTVLDFNCFMNRFAAGESYANCDNSTEPPVLNVLDFNCFINAFSGGCP
jgi:hypothetical protein